MGITFLFWLISTCIKITTNLVHSFSFVRTIFIIKRTVSNPVTLRYRSFTDLNRVLYLYLWPATLTLYPLPVTRYPLPVNRYPYPLPFTLYPLPFTRDSYPLPFTRDPYPLPATRGRNLALFISYLRARKLAASTITSYFSAISYVHKMKGLRDPTKTFLVQKRLTAVDKQKSPDTRLPLPSPFFFNLWVDCSTPTLRQLNVLFLPLCF